MTSVRDVLNVPGENVTVGPRRGPTQQTPVNKYNSENGNKNRAIDLFWPGPTHSSYSCSEASSGPTRMECCLISSCRSSIIPCSSVSSTVLSPLFTASPIFGSSQNTDSRSACGSSSRRSWQPVVRHSNHLRAVCERPGEAVKLRTMATTQVVYGFFDIFEPPTLNPHPVLLIHEWNSPSSPLLGGNRDREHRVRAGRQATQKAVPAVVQNHVRPTVCPQDLHITHLKPNAVEKRVGDVELS